MGNIVVNRIPSWSGKLIHNVKNINTFICTVIKDKSNAFQLRQNVSVLWLFKCYVGNENITLSLKSNLHDGLSWIQTLSSLSQDHWAALIEKISTTFSTNLIRVFSLQVLKNNIWLNIVCIDNCHTLL